MYIVSLCSEIGVQLTSLLVSSQSMSLLPQTASNFILVILHIIPGIPSPQSQQVRSFQLGSAVNASKAAPHSSVHVGGSPWPSHSNTLLQAALCLAISGPHCGQFVMTLSQLWRLGGLGSMGHMGDIWRQRDIVRQLYSSRV